MIRLGRLTLYWPFERALIEARTNLDLCSNTNRHLQDALAKATTDLKNARTALMTVRGDWWLKADGSLREIPEAIVLRFDERRDENRKRRVDLTATLELAGMIDLDEASYTRGVEFRGLQWRITQVASQPLEHFRIGSREPPDVLAMKLTLSLTAIGNPQAPIP